MLKKWIPAFDWMSRYDRQHLHGDLSAGLIVAVMLIPQGMAYAMLAGVDPVIGLYASTIPLFMYALFASSKQLAVGPVAMVALLVFASVSAMAEPGTPEFLTYVIILAFMIGIIQFSLGLFRLGFIVNFLSHAVISGFTSAAAIVIALSQLNNLLGVNLDTQAYTHQLILEAVQKVADIQPITFVIGLTSIIALVFLKKIAPRIPAPIVVVVASILIVYLFRLDERGVQIVGDIPRGLPELSLPAFNIGTIQMLLPVAIMISFIAFMESIAVAKAIGIKEKDKIDANQELKALGLANIVGSFFSSMPVTGGFSRTAVNYQSGAKTGLASMTTAVLIIISLLFLTPLFYYLPNAALAAIIMVAVYGLIDVQEVKHLFKVKPVDGWVLLVTFLTTLFIGIEPGIVTGVLFSLLVFVWKSAHPHIAELGLLEAEGVYRNVRRYPEVKMYEDAIILRIDAPLYFANMAFLENYLHESIAEKPKIKWIILDMSAVNDMDAVAIDQFEEILTEYKHRGIEIVFANMIGPVRDLIGRADWKHKYGQYVTYLSLEHAMKDLNLQERA